MAVLGLWLPLGTQAWAGPPFARMASQLMHAGGRAGTASMRVPAGRLDLRAPAVMAPEPSAPDREFRDYAHHEIMNSPSAARSNLPALGASLGTPRLMSKPEQLARNFRHDGLPVAKLWQNENSLVHIGLNPKGKPGIWVVQKLH